MEEFYAIQSKTSRSQIVNFFSSYLANNQYENSADLIQKLMDYYIYWLNADTDTKKILATDHTKEDSELLCYANLLGSHAIPQIQFKYRDLPFIGRILWYQYPKIAGNIAYAEFSFNNSSYFNKVTTLINAFRPTQNERIFINPCSSLINCYAGEEFRVVLSFTNINTYIEFLKDLKRL